MGLGAEHANRDADRPPRFADLSQSLCFTDTRAERINKLSFQENDTCKQQKKAAKNV